MKIKREMLEELAALDDARLYAKIRGIAEGFGIKLSANVPPKEEMAKLRSLLLGGDKLNLTEAMRVVNNYRRGNK